MIVQKQELEQWKKKKNLLNFENCNFSFSVSAH